MTNSNNGNLLGDGTRLCAGTVADHDVQGPVGRNNNDAEPTAVEEATHWVRQYGLASAAYQIGVQLTAIHPYTHRGLSAAQNILRKGFDPDTDAVKWPGGRHPRNGMPIDNEANREAVQARKAEREAARQSLDNVALVPR